MTANRLANIGATLLLSAITLYAARIFNILFGPLQRICLAVQLLAFLWYLIKAIQRGHLAVALSGAGAALYILFSHGVFCYISGNSPDFNAMAAYLPIISVVFMCESGVRMEVLGRILAWISVFYIILYIGLHDVLIGLNTNTASGVLPSDGLRPDRLFLAAPWAAYAAFYFAKDRKIGPVIRWLCISLAMFSIVLSGTRGFLFIFGIIFGLYLIGQTGVWVRSSIFSIFLLVVACLVGGLVFTNWNPYALFASDNSASYRAMEFTRAVAAIRTHWFFGVGLPDQPEALSSFLRTARYETMYPSDLGALGILLMMGIPGLAICIAAVYFCTLGSAEKSTSVVVQATQGTCLQMASIAWLSPMLMVEPPSMFVGMLIAIYVRSYRAANLRVKPSGSVAGHPTVCGTEMTGILSDCISKRGTKKAAGVSE